MLKIPDTYGFGIDVSLPSAKSYAEKGVDCCDEKLRVLINDAYDLLSAEKSDIIPDDETAAKVIKELIEKDYRKKFDVTVQNQDFGKRTFESDSLACKFKHKNKFFLAFSTRNDNQNKESFNIGFKATNSYQSFGQLGGARSHSGHLKDSNLETDETKGIVITAFVDV
ncbi:unnamed protein product [Enterobius vermicularis]|uniref:DUF3223 domain-containing protein n=1 Tax=Enterobius vermicularis TaxID=51028 RepID=A0A0N4VC97_ENTVE|nr:unnamed protein product [Enterobius vermicularis]